MKKDDILSIKSAVKARNVEDLSSTHLTTAEIGQILPIWAVETIIGGNYPVKATHFSRLAPLVKPTYGKMYFKTATMFIPYYQICDNFDGWMNGNKTVNGEIAASRHIKRRTILEVFTDAAISTEVSAADVATGSWFDFRCQNGSTDKYYKFRNIGKYYIKVLNSLGYVIPMNGNSNSSNPWYTTGYGSKNLNALPLIAFAKGYNDWMSQSQRFNISVLTKLLFAIKKDKTMSYQSNTVYDATTHCITKMGLILILDNIRLMYENDYFIQAWQQPNAPLTGQEYSLNGNQNSQSVDNNQLYTDEDDTENVNYNNSIWRGNNGTYVSTDVEFSTSGETDPEGVEVFSEGSLRITLAKRTMDYLDAFDRYVKRNNYAGSKDVQQIYARFGIKIEDFKSNYSHLIAKSTAPIQIGDITATAQDFVAAGNENNVAIGDYAGKGIISNSEKYNYKANEVGLLCTYAWITTAPMNVYGEDRMVKRVTPIDFYTPEFDGIGPEAISVDEVYNNPRIWSNTKPEAVYGFVEKYNSFRYGKDRITGDFRKMPLDTGTYANTGTEMNTWHLGRFLNSQLQSQTLVAQNPSINQLKPTDTEYNRIFSVTSGNEDHFYITSQVQCKALLPILSKNQTPGLGEGKTVVAKNGNEIN